MTETFTPLVPLPVVEAPEGLDLVENVADRADGLISHYGHCADFCNATDLPSSGSTLTDHGRWCMTNVGLPAEARSVQTGAKLDLFVEVVRPYMHGLYRPEDMPTDRREQVSLSVIDHLAPNEENVVLTPAEARSLAATLVRAADVASRLTAAHQQGVERRARGADQS